MTAALLYYLIVIPGLLWQYRESRKNSKLKMPSAIDWSQWIPGIRARETGNDAMLKLPPVFSFDLGYDCSALMEMPE